MRSHLFAGVEQKRWIAARNVAEDVTENIDREFEQIFTKKVCGTVNSQKKTDLIEAWLLA